MTETLTTARAEDVRPEPPRAEASVLTPPEVDVADLPRDLAGLTAVFYGVTYLGFAVPAIMATLAQDAGFSYPAMFEFGAIMAALCLAVVVIADRRMPANG